MYPQVNPKQSFPALERETLAYWKANNTFKKSLEIREGAPEFNFYDGPPFATGTPHYGHLLAGTIKDVIPRYQTMQGKYVERRFGWDCHGLPIENIVEKKLGISGKKDIEDKIGVYEFNEGCRANVFGYTDIWKQTVERMGRWVDMDNDYKTMDTDFMESVWWVFSEIYKKGLIYESYRVVPYCPRCSTPLSNFEVNQGYEDKQDKAVTVKFKVKGSANKYVLAWTTTPWTLPANLGLAVGAEIVYVELSDKASSETYILAKDCIASYYKNPEDYTVIREYPGSCLVGIEYEPIWCDYRSEEVIENITKYGDMMHTESVQGELTSVSIHGHFDKKLGENKWNTKIRADQEHSYRIIPGHHVTTESGTGVVHIAPAYGEDDFQIGKKEQLGFISHIDDTGKTEYLPEKSDNGIWVFDFNETVLNRLKTEKKIIHIGTIDHSYPHCYRCHTPLIYRAISAWYVNVESIKDKMIANNEKITWVPDTIKHGRFGKWVEGARDWNISRNRYWGSAIPVWKSEDGDVKVIGSVEELYQANREFGDITKIIFVRHGESDNSKLHITDYEGVYDLNEKGKEQAKKLEERLSGMHFDAVFSSPSSRCVNTIQEIANSSDREVVKDQRLQEIRNNNQGLAYIDRPLDLSSGWNGGESFQQVTSRVTEFLEETIDAYRGKTILICAHGDTSHILKKEYDKLLGNSFPKSGEPHELYFYSNSKQPVDLHKHFVDQIKLSKDGKTYTRIPEVLDCWFESGSMPYASKHYPFSIPPTPLSKGGSEAGGSFKFPADFIAEGLDQTRGWFYTLLILGTALFDNTPFLNVIVNGMILAEDGKKMSKSLSNYPDPMELVERHGADALRFYMLSSPVVKADDLRFSEAGVEEVVKKVLLPLWNTYSFFTTYANIDNFVPNTTEIYFMRHGQTDANLEGRLSDGLDNSPLNATGKTQAEEAGKQILANHAGAFDVIIASPLVRAHETAEIIAKTIGHKGEIIFDESFIERLGGKFSGMRFEDIEREMGIKIDYTKSGHMQIIHEGEDFEDIYNRVSDGYQKLLQKYQGKRILIVSHGGVYRPLLRFTKGLSLEEAYAFKGIGNCEVVKLFAHPITNKLDVWIISRLNRLIAMVEGGFEAYDLQIPTRAILEFMDELTNWYIRRSRRRFWKSENDGDKLGAYETLYHVLVTLIKVMAPITPMISEAVYRGLTLGESIHLERFPEYSRTSIFPTLDADMNRVREIITLGLALRGQKKIRVRQPLASITIGEPLSEYFQEIICEELNVKAIKIEDMSHVARKICKPNAKLIGAKFGKAVQDIIIQAKSGNFEELDGGRIQINLPDKGGGEAGGFVVLEESEYEIAYEPIEGVVLDVMSGSGMVVAMDTKITKELELEGYARDIVRVIQDLRKEAGYEVSDRIGVNLTGDSIDAILALFSDYITSETLSTIDSSLTSGDISKEIEMEGMMVNVVVKK